MTIKNNAAQVAVMAEPCLNLAAETVLPTTKQTMLMALAFVQRSLEHLAHHYDGGWDDADTDVDMVAYLALEQIKRLREDLPDDRDTFECRWFEAAAAINLGVRAFSRPDSSYFRALKRIQQQFEVLAPAVEFIGEEMRNVL